LQEHNSYFSQTLQRSYTFSINDFLSTLLANRNTWFILIKGPHAKNIIGFNKKNAKLTKHFPLPLELIQYLVGATLMQLITPCRLLPYILFLILQLHQYFSNTQAIMALLQILLLTDSTPLILVPLINPWSVFSLPLSFFQALKACQ